MNETALGTMLLNRDRLDVAVFRLLRELDWDYSDEFIRKYIFKHPAIDLAALTMLLLIVRPPFRKYVYAHPKWYTRKVKTTCMLS